MSGPKPRDSLRESLTGPASISLTGWLTTLVPASLLVIVQEASTPFPTFAFVLLSAAVQHAADGVLAALALAVQRRAPALDRLVVRLFLWTAIGTSRGLIGGAIAAAVAGVDADYGYRVAFWLLVTWTWMPAIGYTLAQLEARRDLLGARDAARAALESDRVSDAEQRDSLRSSLLGAVQAGIGPAVDEIRERLLRMGGSLDPAATRQIGDRIAGIVDDADTIVRGVPGSRRPGVPTVTPRASVWAAIEFDQRRPLVTAAVMGLGMATLLLPETLRVAGGSATLLVALGILASVAIVFLTALLERVVRPRPRPAQIAALALRVLVAGLAGSGTILLLGGHENPEIVVPAALLPIVAGLAAAIVPTIAGIRQANAAVRSEIDELSAQREQAREESKAEEARVRAQVAELLHGPIQGRLSACAMALGFHAAAETPADAARTAFITTSVLDHLTAVANDLEALAHPHSGGGGEPPPS